MESCMSYMLTPMSSMDACQQSRQLQQDHRCSSTALPFSKCQTLHLKPVVQP